VSRDISGRRKCREEWPSVATERAYNLFLDGTLLLIPLLLMSLAYSLIAVKLWRGLKLEIRQTSTNTRRRKWSVVSTYVTVRIFARSARQDGCHPWTAFPKASSVDFISSPRNFQPRCLLDERCIDCIELSPTFKKQLEGTVIVQLLI